MRNRPIRSSLTPRRASCAPEAASTGPDPTCRPLSKSLTRFDRKWKEQQQKMEQTVSEFALTVFERESRLCEDQTGILAEASEQENVGKPGQLPQAETLMVTLDTDLARRLRVAADEGRRTLSSVMDSAARDWLEGYEMMQRKRRSLLAGLSVKR